MWLRVCSKNKRKRKGERLADGAALVGNEKECEGSCSLHFAVRFAARQGRAAGVRDKGVPPVLTHD